MQRVRNIRKMPFSVLNIKNTKREKKNNKKKTE